MVHFKKDTPETALWCALRKDEEAHKDAVAQAKSTLEATLRRYRYFENLIADWPEIEPFARGLYTATPEGKVLLPALPAETLNTTFKLPAVGKVVPAKPDNA